METTTFLQRTKEALRSQLFAVLSVICLFAAPATTADAQVCRIGSAHYNTLAATLEAHRDGETITLLANINHNEGVVVRDKQLILELNGFTLNVNNPNGIGLNVYTESLLYGTRAAVTVGYPGEFNITGTTYRSKY